MGRFQGLSEDEAPRVADDVRNVLDVLSPRCGQFLRCRSIAVGRKPAELTTAEADDKLLRPATLRNDHVDEPCFLARRNIHDLPSRAAENRNAMRARRWCAWSRVSGGLVEGHVNRAKAIKVMSYDRAKFDLLRARLLHAG